MEQYEKSGPKVEVDKKEKNSQDQVHQLQIQVQQQQETIDKLTRDLRLLKNELRVAVNAFNLQKRG